MDKNVMKKNILIWGAGEKGENTYKLLEGHRMYTVTAFGDNNVKMQGKEKFGKPIISPDEIHLLEKLYCIVIAAACPREIKQQLQKYIEDKIIYDSIEELMYTRISIDISGCCNARCKWCVTGKENRCNKPSTVYYMKVQEFIRLYQHIYGIGLIEKSTEIMLYSWGEPLLNEDYIEIVEYLADQNQVFSMSTNASVVKITEKENTYKTCKAFIFSMPGFSQMSYNKIHGFNFKRIRENIEKLVLNIRQAGFEGDGSISFHVYKFNTQELSEAHQFAESLNLRFNPYYPYFNGNSMTEEFLEGKMDRNTLQEAGEELYLDHVKELIAKRPKDYRCFLENIISIDCHANLVLCCAADPALSDYEWKSVFQIFSIEGMRKQRGEMLKSQSCKKCRKLGIDYWMGKNPSYTY